jgi:hypothetical protein
MEEFVIDIEQDGTPRVEGVGFSGPECVKLSAAIVDALGETVKQVKKPDYHRSRVLRKQV